LRDGGYYTSWNFEKNLVHRYVDSISKASVDVMEIGFRFPTSISQKGPFAYSLDRFIETLRLPKGLEYCVMINAADYINLSSSEFISLSSTRQKDLSKISMFRIAVNFNEFQDSREISVILKELGYEVAINLMQAQEKERSEYRKVSKEIDSWGTTNILYFADSFGTMDQKEVANIIKYLKENWKGKLGFHSHNNRGDALNNSIEAAKNGIDWVDSTICGMGRGAGNASTKKLIENLNKLNLHNGDCLKLNSTEEDFSLLKKEFNWGQNQYYEFAALNSIHPTYVQNLLSEKRYSSKEVKGILKNLSKMGSSKYDPDKLINAFYAGQHSTTKGKWNASKWLQDEEIILIGPGSSVSKKREQILEFVRKNNLKVFFLNKNNNFPEEYAFTTIVSNIDRAMVDLILLKESKSRVVLPYDKLKGILKKKDKNSILDYGLILEENKFESNASYCKLFTPNVSAYALALMYQAGVKTVYTAGLDGYPKGDKRNEVMEKIFLEFKGLTKSPPLISITKSSYGELEFKDINSFRP